MCGLACDMPEEQAKRGLRRHGQINFADEVALASVLVDGRVEAVIDARGHEGMGAHEFWLLLPYHVPSGAGSKEASTRSLSISSSSGMTPASASGPRLRLSPLPPPAALAATLFPSP